ncbi:uncharacterized protein LOC128267836 [Anopheles cruzii]|uniref:uncharacterized protein LOC128267836 n=1 Tax=Anopheles cruzii TaxID=68878 RepID=UPI0022EC253D|nr:uncharacterized protein LOC128267836 [Anopheles cruzii]
MSSARCLNWSRPPPGRHPVLRKQVSCIEPSVNTTTGPTTTAAAATAVTVTDGTTGRRCDHFCQFLVTGAIIHTDRFQNYHTYNQAHRGGSGSVSSSAAAASIVHPASGQQRRARPASASSGCGGGRSSFSGPAAGSHHPPSAGSDQERTRAANRRANLLCKQLSLDQSILVAATATTAAAAAGMAAVATATGATVPPAEPSEAGGWTFGRKPRAGGPLKSDMMDAGTVGKKGLKSGKDARINIKIFLGQTVQQQDSSDTGVSDTEGPSAVPPGGPGVLPLQKSDSTPAMSMVMPAKPASGTAGGTSAGGAASGAAAISGRNSSLAQRRAQFQANRQNSEAHDRRHPPLVRAMSAPIRPADPDTSKFLQSKKKSRRKKALREKDEYNICEEDEYSDDGGGGGGGAGGGVLGLPNGAGGAKSSLVATLPLRSRSVLGGACDIETLVSLLSSGGSDSEKEQESAAGATPQQSSDFSLPAGPVPLSYRQAAAFSSTVGHLKGRAPMLKKAGKSVSFQESDLKPVPATAGLNRDYRKPGAFQSAVAANRMRRTQQLVHTLNAFQLKDRVEQETDTGEDTVRDGTEGDKGGASTTGQPTTVTSAPTTKPASGKSEAKSAHGNASGGGAAATNGASDLETPKEQECYRLFLKMSRKGLSVSYDTILRGMLTPTELRVLQKKKSLQRTDTIDEQGIAGELAPDGLTGGPQNGVPAGAPVAERLSIPGSGATGDHTKRELECDGPTIHQEPTPAAAAVAAEETKDEKEEVDQVDRSTPP